MRRWLIKLISGWLKGTDLSIEERTLLSQAVLKQLGALPIHDVIKVEKGSLYVNGRLVDEDLRMKLRESARGLLSNQAFQYVRNQVLFGAITHGIHKGGSDIALLFSRAAIWYGQQEDININLLAEDF